MAGVLGWVDAVTGAPSYIGRSLRQFSSVHLAGATAARPFGGISGVAVGSGTPCSITGTGPYTWNITNHAGVLDLETSALAGAQPYTINTTQSGTITAAPSAPNSRIDIISLRQDDPAESDGSSVPAVTVLYTVGTAANPGTQPATPARSLLIAVINVPNAGAPTIAWVAPNTVAAGGILPITGATQRPTPYDGEANYRQDSNSVEIYNGASYDVFPPIAAAVQVLVFTPGANLDTTTSGTATWMTLGNVTVPPWATQCIVQWNIYGYYLGSGAVSLFTNFALKIGSAAGVTRRILDPAVTLQRTQSAIAEPITGLTAGSQSVTISATYVSGSGAAYRADTNTRSSVMFIFLP